MEYPEAQKILGMIAFLKTVLLVRHSLMPMRNIFNECCSKEIAIYFE